MVESFQPEAGLGERNRIGPVGAERGDATLGPRRHRELVDLRRGQRGLDLRILVDTVAVVLSMEGTTGTRGAQTSMTRWRTGV